MFQVAWQNWKNYRQIYFQNAKQKQSDSTEGISASPLTSKKCKNKITIG